MADGEGVTVQPDVASASSVTNPARGVEEAEYARQRLAPRPGDMLYLPSSDLRQAIETVATPQPLRILDYGADLAPYTPLFPNSDYRLADIGDSAAMHYRIGADGAVPERDETFDLVLSTQVAEHVEDPRLYLAECLRLLRPGGTLFLSTHGAYEDHAFPADYQRWTAAGLRRDLTAAGFQDVRVLKLTAGPRAGVFQMERWIETTYLRRTTVPGALHWLARHAMRALRPLVHRLADRWYADFRVVGEEVPFQNMYICLAAVARKPTCP